MYHILNELTNGPLDCRKNGVQNVKKHMMKIFGNRYIK